MNERVKKAVLDSDMDEMSKNLCVGYIDRALDYNNSLKFYMSIVEMCDTFSTKQPYEIVTSTNEVIVYKLVNPKNDFDLESPYRVIFKNLEGTWSRAYQVAHSLDAAMLVYLQSKYPGESSQFGTFAMKMLGMANE